MRKVNQTYCSKLLQTTTEYRHFPGVAKIQYNLLVPPPGSLLRCQAIGTIDLCRCRKTAIFDGLLGCLHCGVQCCQTLSALRLPFWRSDRFIGSWKRIR